MVILPSIRRKYMTRRDPGGKIPLGDAVITLDKDVWQYTGSEITPTPVVTLYGNLLTVNVDFTVGYTGNVEVGQGVVTVTGMGQYSGQRQKSFVIEAAPAPSEDFDISTAVQVGDSFRPDGFYQGCGIDGVEEKNGVLNVFAHASQSDSYENRIIISPDGNGEYHLTGMGSSAASKTSDATLSGYIRAFCVSNGGSMLFCSKNGSFDSKKFLIGDGMDLSRITASDEFDTSEFGLPPERCSFFITPDGMNLIVATVETIGGVKYPLLKSYSLSVPFDVSSFSGTATWSVRIDDIRGDAYKTNAIGFYNSGRIMLILYHDSTYRDSIYQFTLSTPYDARTATLFSKKSFQTTYSGMMVLNGGKTLITLRDNGYFTEYVLSK